MLSRYEGLGLPGCELRESRGRRKSVQGNGVERMLLRARTKVGSIRWTFALQGSYAMLFFKW